MKLLPCFNKRTFQQIFPSAPFLLYPNEIHNILDLMFKTCSLCLLTSVYPLVLFYLLLWVYDLHHWPYCASSTTVLDPKTFWPSSLLKSCWHIFCTFPLPNCSSFPRRQFIYLFFTLWPWPVSWPKPSDLDLYSGLNPLTLTTILNLTLWPWPINVSMFFLMAPSSSITYTSITSMSSAEHITNMHPHFKNSICTQVEW